MTDDRTTPQDVVDSAVERKGAEWLRENFEQHMAPIRVMGMDVSREEVTIPEPADDDGEDADP